MMPTRLLIYVQHLLGVGHVKRAAAIARACTRAGMQVRVVLGGEPVAHIDFGGAEIVALTPVRALDMTFKMLVTGEGQPVNEEVWRGRREALLKTEREFCPDALLVEHFPFGRRQFAAELAPLIGPMRAAKKPVICSVRDVLVDKKDIAKSRKTAAIARASFDRILVHGDPKVLAFERTFPATEAIADLIAYTGYIVEDGAHVPAPGREGEGEVIVSTGGGAVGAPLLTAASEAARAGALAPRTWRLLAGANMPAADFARLQASSGGNCVGERARPDFCSLLKRCALSVSQAGYNTVMDVLLAGCPALVVPFAGAEESEQALRAHEFARRGLLTELDEAELSPVTLAHAATEALRMRRESAIRIEVDGARRSAELILAAVEYGRGRRAS